MMGLKNSARIYYLVIIYAFVILKYPPFCHLIAVMHMEHPQFQENQISTNIVDGLLGINIA
jgi:hypothetical protein